MSCTKTDPVVSLMSADTRGQCDSPLAAEQMVLGMHRCTDMPDGSGGDKTANKREEQ